MPRRKAIPEPDAYDEDGGDAYAAYDDRYDQVDQVGQYDEGYDLEYADDPSPQGEPLIRQALDWGISGSIVAILVLTAVYALLPIDAIPDFIPFAGQADDIAAILAGGGSVTFLTILRYVLRTRIGRWGCLVTIVLAAIGAFTVFWALLRLFDAVL